MSVSDDILKIKNKICAKALLEVSTEGNVREWSIPYRCNVLNKKTGEKWCVEFHTMPREDPDWIYPSIWCADLKNEKGEVLESVYFSEKIPDKLLPEKSAYKHIWKSVSTEFKNFKETHRHIKDNEEKGRGATNLSAIKKLKKFLGK